MNNSQITDLVKEDIEIKSKPSTVGASVRELQITSEKEKLLKKQLDAVRTIKLPYYS